MRFQNEEMKSKSGMGDADIGDLLDKIEKVF
jgi:hypothetical protein